MQSNAVVLMSYLLFVGIGMADGTAPIQTNAKELAGIENDAEFDERFGDKVVQVSGSVGGVYRSTKVKDGVPLEYIVVLFEGRKGEDIIEMQLNVSAKHRNKIAKYREGQVVSLRGRCCGKIRPGLNHDGQFFLKFDDGEPADSPE